MLQSVEIITCRVPFETYSLKAPYVVQHTTYLREMMLRNGRELLIETEHGVFTANFETDAYAKRERPTPAFLRLADILVLSSSAQSMTLRDLAKLIFAAPPPKKRRASSHASQPINKTRDCATEQPATLNT